MTDRTAAERYQRFFAIHSDRIYAKRSTRRIIRNRDELTTDGRRLQELYAETKVLFMRSLETNENRVHFE